MKTQRLMRSLFPIVASLFFSLATPVASAQVLRPAQSNHVLANDLLKQYRSAAPGALKNQELLISMMRAGLTDTDENFDAIRESFYKSKVPEEKALLLRAMSSMYRPKERSARNLSIENDIKSLVSSSDISLAREAVFEYSRLGYPPDRHDVLVAARKNNLIGDDGYYGEIAHGLRFSSASDQERDLKELSLAHNKYSTEILSDMFTNPKLVNQLNETAKRNLAKILIDNEPKFPSELDRFGLIDAVRYSNWLSAYANIQSSLGLGAYSDIAVNRMLLSGTDPRKILGVFIDTTGRRIVTESSDKQKLRSLLLIGTRYSQSLPQNQMLKDAVTSFSNLLGDK